MKYLLILLFALSLNAQSVVLSKQAGKLNLSNHVATITYEYIFQPKSTLTLLHSQNKVLPIGQWRTVQVFTNLNLRKFDNVDPNIEILGQNGIHYFRFIVTNRFGNVVVSKTLTTHVLSAWEMQSLNLKLK